MSDLIVSHLVRADWHAAYDAGCWAFVPTLDILTKMIGAKKTFTRVRMSLLLKIYSHLPNYSHTMDTERVARSIMF